MKKKILVIGYGILGKAIPKASWSKSFLTEVASRSAKGADILDIRKKRSVDAFFEKHHDYAAVINCAAKTDVDACEKEPEEARAVNALGVMNLCDSLKRFELPLIQVSTNYVFSGNKESAYAESDKADPCSVYGLTKLEGEHYALSRLPYCVVVRSSWIFGGRGNDFVSIFMERFQKQKDLNVAGDQASSATYAKDLAEAIGAILNQELLPSAEKRKRIAKIYHVANQGVCSRYDMVNFMAQTLRKKVKVTPIPRSKLNSWSAVRPAYSALSSEAYEKAFKTPLRDWKDALKDCLEHLG